MACDADIIRTADICDDFGAKAIGATVMPPRKDGIGRRGVEIYLTRSVHDL